MRFRAPTSIPLQASPVLGLQNGLTSSKKEL
jgi:hypothetical protein